MFDLFWNCHTIASFSAFLRHWSFFVEGLENGLLGNDLINGKWEVEKRWDFGFAHNASSILKWVHTRWGWVVYGSERCMLLVTWKWPRIDGDVGEGLKFYGKTFFNHLVYDNLILIPIVVIVQKKKNQIMDVIIY